MLAKAYVLKTADRLISYNCNACIRDSRLIVETNQHELIADVCLNIDAAIPYEIVFTNGTYKIATFGSAQGGVTLVRQRQKDVIVIAKLLF